MALISPLDFSHFQLISFSHPFPSILCNIHPSALCFYNPYLCSQWDLIPPTSTEPKPLVNTEIGSGAGYKTYRATRWVGQELIANLPSPVNSLGDIWHTTVSEFGDKPCLCWRERDSDGVAGPYTSISYLETDTIARELGSFLLSQTSLEAHQPLGLWSINRPRWNIGNLASILYNLVAVPLYSSLGKDAIEYVIGHAELKVLVISSKHLEKLLTLKRDGRIEIETYVFFF